MTLNAPDGVAAEGRYVYCVAKTGESVNMGAIGIDGSQVYTAPYRDISAVVHDCLAEPYNSDDRDRLRTWAMAHQATVESAWERWRAVLPVSFNTIIKVGAGVDAGQSIRLWLEGSYDGLKQKLARVVGKAEYGVQVFWEPRVIANGLAGFSSEIRDLELEIQSKPRGLAYMYRQRLERLLRLEMEAGVDRVFKDCYNRIRPYADDVRVEKLKKAEGDIQMIVNLSCLVPAGRYRDLGEELDRIGRTNGLSVRFTGPWPPYSFVG
ncbi:MAG: GvpL/GvpF family gas vesicle protein [Dehalococcoidia bacterium]|nr:GvpL/GvpF family gas vesicle protein [Dehalococcoidia bacterium]